MACGILVPQPGTESVPSEIEVQSLNHWDAEEVLNSNAFKFNLRQGAITLDSVASTCISLQANGQEVTTTAKSAHLAAQSNRWVLPTRKMTSRPVLFSCFSQNIRPEA